MTSDELIRMLREHCVGDEQIYLDIRLTPKCSTRGPLLAGITVDPQRKQAVLRADDEGLRWPNT